eukprot:4365337-Amphidinium_carterae.1
MQIRGRHYGAQAAQCSRSVDINEPRERARGNQCVTRIGNDQWDTPHSIIDRSVSGEIPMKGRSKLYRAGSRRIDRHSDPASSHQTDKSVPTQQPRKRQRSGSSSAESTCEGKTTQPRTRGNGGTG